MENEEEDVCPECDGYGWVEDDDAEGYCPLCDGCGCM